MTHGSHVEPAIPAERPVLLLWEGTGDALATHPDPGPVRDWAMITALLAWMDGHGWHGGYQVDPASQAITCKGCGQVVYQVAPAGAVAA